MVRITLLAGTIALATLAPVAAVAIPPPAVPVHRPAIAPRSAPARMADRPAYGDTFKLHYDLNTAPNLRMAEEPLPAFSRLVPAPACFANNAAMSQWAPSSVAVPPGAGETLGSLVDDRSRNLFASKPSQATQLPLADSSALTASPLTIQYGVSPLTCGPPSMFVPPQP